MGKYEVTFDEYDVFARMIGRDGGCADGHRIKKPWDEGWGRGRRPVINVSWTDAVCYFQWLSKKTKAANGQEYRLPSEAEWEYAARAGTRTKYWWGNSEKDAKQNAVCTGCKSTWSGKKLGSKTAEVDDSLFQPNPWGLHHMAGNVTEWVEDCWQDNYEGAPKNGSAWEKAKNSDCGRRVIRGGSWLFKPWYVRSADRSWSAPVYRYIHLGFRLAQDL